MNQLIAYKRDLGIFACQWDGSNETKEYLKNKLQIEIVTMMIPGTSFTETLIETRWGRRTLHLTDMVVVPDSCSLPIVMDERDFLAMFTEQKGN